VTALPFWVRLASGRRLPRTTTSSRMRSRSRKMLSARQLTILWGVLGVCTAVLGLWILATGEEWIGVGFVLVGLGQGALAFIAWWKPEAVDTSRPPAC
jgi:hypothetical protein